MQPGSGGEFHHAAIRGYAKPAARRAQVRQRWRRTAQHAAIRADAAPARVLAGVGGTAVGQPDDMANGVAGGRQVGERSQSEIAPAPDDCAGAVMGVAGGQQLHAAAGVRDPGGG